MKKVQKTDVADFIREKTENFKMKAPDHVWSNIQSSIGKSGSMSNMEFLTRYKYMFGTIGLSVISVIIIAILTFNPDTKNAQKANQQVADYSANTNEIQRKTHISSFPDTEVLQTEESAIPVTTEQKMEETPFSSPKKKPASEDKSKEPVIQEKQISKETEIQEQEIVQEEQQDASKTETPIVREEKKKEYFINQSQYGKIHRLVISNQAGEVLIDMVPEINSSNFLPVDISNLEKGTYILHIHTDTEIVKKDLHIK
jgi:hypothetical protein